MSDHEDPIDFQYKHVDLYTTVVTITKQNGETFARILSLVPKETVKQENDSPEDTLPLPKKGWVQVEDALPPFYKTVLVVRGSYDTTNGGYTLAYLADCAGNLYWYTGKQELAISDITYWMKLPPFPDDSTDE